MTRPRAAVTAILVLVAAAGVWNAATYPPGHSYDAHWYVDYVEAMWERGELPREGAYYTPPGFFSIAGALIRAAERVGLGEPLRAVQLFDGMLALGTAVLLLLLARMLWPERPVLHVGAVGIFGLGPWVLKAAAMFHPEPLSLFLCTLALLLATQMLLARRFRFGRAVLLGLTLGAAQLVRAFSLWTLAVVVFGFLAAALIRADPGPGRVLAAGGVVLLVAMAVPAPWYVRQTIEFGHPIFAPAPPDVPLLQRRPTSFYVDPGLPEAITAPHRPHFANRIFPQLYADVWGDYFGVFAWDAADMRPSKHQRARLATQSVVGLLPTALALAGWGLLLAAALRPLRPELVPAALLPLAGLAGMLYFGVSHPTPDGDVIKAQYMLTTAPAWALAFGLAVDRLWSRRPLRIALGAILLAAAAVSWSFSLYGYPLGV